MTDTLPVAATPRRTDRDSAWRVSIWLYALAALVVAMVAIGGATRLTGSGLSITEWKPVTGAVPPLSETAWQAEFDKYRGSSQYRNLNAGMSLAEFKSIYWWEWGHRQLGRLIGIAFFVPLVAFWWSGAITTAFAAWLAAIGALGGLQAAVGWIMVRSGLEPGMVAVAPVKLTLHLLIASAILALLVWTAARLRPAPADEEARPRWGGMAAAILLGVVFLQIGLGGLVAGARAGWTYNTWPLMDGRLVPGGDALFAMQPSLENWVANPALVQFNHRLTAYAVVLLAVLQAVAWLRAAPGTEGARRAVAISVLTLAQMALGIATLLLAVPLWAGLAHQVLAALLLCVATFHAARSASGSTLVERPLDAASPLRTARQPG